MSLRTVFAPALWVSHFLGKVSVFIASTLGHVPLSYRWGLWLNGLLSVGLAGASLTVIVMLWNSEDPRYQLEPGPALELLVGSYLLLCAGIGSWVAARELPATKPAPKSSIRK